MRTRVHPRHALAVIMAVGKLPARGPSTLRAAADLRVPGRDNPTSVAFPKSVLWALLAIGVAALVVAVALLLGLFILR